jgi:hypothetical protein
MQARHKIIAALATDIAMWVEGVNEGKGRQTREALAVTLRESTTLLSAIMGSP